MKEVIERAIDTLTGADPLSLYRKTRPKSSESTVEPTALPAGDKVSALERRDRMVSVGEQAELGDVAGDQGDQRPGRLAASKPLERKAPAGRATEGIQRADHRPGIRSGCSGRYSGVSRSYRRRGRPRSDGSTHAPCHSGSTRTAAASRTSANRLALTRRFPREDRRARRLSRHRGRGVRSGVEHHDCAQQVRRPDLLEVQPESPELRPLPARCTSGRPDARTSPPTAGPAGTRDQKSTGYATAAVAYEQRQRTTLEQRGKTVDGARSRRTLTRYAEPVGNGWTGGQEIRPLTETRRGLVRRSPDQCGPDREAFHNRGGVTPHARGDHYSPAWCRVLTVTA